MNKILLALFLLTLVLILPRAAFAQQRIDPLKQEYERAVVVSVDGQGTRNTEGVKNPFQNITVEIMDGDDKGKKIHIKSGSETTLATSQIVTKGEKIVITKIFNPNKSASYQVYDTYRMNSLLYLFIAFLAVVIAIAGLKGVG